MKAVIIISALVFIALVMVWKLYKENEFKRIAREGKGYIQELVGHGLTKSEAYSRLTPSHKKAINECDRLKLKY